jgi:hypothetical protein
MANIAGDYWQFYIEGREQRRLLKHDIAEDALAEEMVRTGARFRDVVSAACEKAAAPLDGGKLKKIWITEHNDQITAAGGDTRAAYAAFLQGKADELAYALEPGVVEALREQFGEEGDDEDEDDEDD